MKSFRPSVMLVSITIIFALSGFTGAEPILDFDTPLPPELRKQPLIAVDDNIAVPCPEGCAVNVSPHFGGELGFVGVVSAGQTEPAIYFVVDNASATHALALTYSVYDYIGRLVAFQRLTPKVKVGSTPVYVAAAQLAVPGLYRLKYEAKDTMSGRQLASGERWYAIVPDKRPLRSLLLPAVDEDGIEAGNMSRFEVERIKEAPSTAMPALRFALRDEAALANVQAHGLQHYVRQVWVTLDVNRDNDGWPHDLWQSLERDWFAMGGAAFMTPVTPVEPFVPADDQQRGDQWGQADIEQAVAWLHSLLAQQRAGIHPVVTWPRHARPSVDPANVEGAWRPTSAVLAYTAWHDNVADAVYVGALSTPAHAFAHVYLKHGVPVLVAGTTGGEQEVTWPHISSEKVRVVNMQGAARDVPTVNNSLTLTLGPEPVYVHDPGLATVGRAIIDDVTPRVERLVRSYAPHSAAGGEAVVTALRELATELWLADVNGASAQKVAAAWARFLATFVDVGYELAKGHAADETVSFAGLLEFYRMLPMVAELGEAAGVMTGRLGEDALTAQFLEQITAAAEQWQQSRTAQAPQVNLLLQFVGRWHQRATGDSAAIVAREAALLAANQLEQFPLLFSGVYVQGADTGNAHNVHDVVRAVRVGGSNQTAAGWDTLPLDLIVTNTSGDDVDATLSLHVPDGWVWAHENRFIAQGDGIRLRLPKQKATAVHVTVAVPFQAPPGSYKLPVRLTVANMLGDSMIVTVQVPES